MTCYRFALPWEPHGTSQCLTRPCLPPVTLHWASGWRLRIPLVLGCFLPCHTNLMGAAVTRPSPPSQSCVRVWEMAATCRFCAPVSGCDGCQAEMEGERQSAGSALCPRRAWDGVERRWGAHLTTYSLSWSKTDGCVCLPLFPLSSLLTAGSWLGVGDAPAGACGPWWRLQ